jgi:hypothetical protein
MEKTGTKSSEYDAHLRKLCQYKEHSTNAANEEHRQQMKGNKLQKT